MKDQKKEAMFARVDEWIKSGRTLREFSASIGLSKSCFEYWVRKKRKAWVTSPSFLEITSLANPVHDVETIAKQAVPGSQEQIVFTFPSGMCIKVYG